MKKQYQYTSQTWRTMSLTIICRIAPFMEEGAPENITGNPAAYFYEITQGRRKKQQFLTSPHGKSMNSEEAQTYLFANIDQIVTTYQATEIVE